MNKYVTKEEFPKVEMQLFGKEYPCYLMLNIFVLDGLTIHLETYETEFIEGKWLLVTKK